MAILGSCAIVTAGSALAADQPQMRQGSQVRQEQRTRIYGFGLMTQQERNDYRNRMRAAKTERERKHIRAEHHARMQERAKKKGVTLPDSPPPRRGPPPGGAGMGYGSGMGQRGMMSGRGGGRQ